MEACSLPSTWLKTIGERRQNKPGPAGVRVCCLGGYGGALRFYCVVQVWSRCCQSPWFLDPGSARGLTRLHHPPLSPPPTTNTTTTTASYHHIALHPVPAGRPASQPAMLVMLVTNCPNAQQPDKGIVRVMGPGTGISTGTGTGTGTVAARQIRAGRWICSPRLPLCGQDTSHPMRSPRPGF